MEGKLPETKKSKHALIGKRSNEKVTQAVSREDIIQCLVHVI
jgi:hypothetical protein